MTYQDPPIICDRCPLLALARMNGIVLCVECLTSSVAERGCADIAGISPLGRPSSPAESTSPAAKDNLERHER